MSGALHRDSQNLSNKAAPRGQNSQPSRSDLQQVAAAAAGTHIKRNGSNLLPTFYIPLPREERFLPYHLTQQTRVEVFTKSSRTRSRRQQPPSSSPPSCKSANKGLGRTHPLTMVMVCIYGEATGGSVTGSATISPAMSSTMKPCSPASSSISTLAPSWYSRIQQRGFRKPIVPGTSGSRTMFSLLLQSLDHNSRRNRKLVLRREGAFERTIWG